MNEIQQGHTWVGDARTKHRHRQPNDLLQIQPHLACAQHPHHTESVAAQSEGIAVAGRQIANAKHAHQGFEFVGQGHHHANDVAWQLIARKAWFVMVFNRLSNIF